MNKGLVCPYCHIEHCGHCHCRDCATPSPQPVLPEDVEKRFDEMYLQITAQDRPVWAGYQYVTHHACIKDFIATELTRLEAEKEAAVEDALKWVSEYMWSPIAEGWVHRQSGHEITLLDIEIYMRQGSMDTNEALHPEQKQGEVKVSDSPPLNSFGSIPALQGQGEVEHE